MAITAKTIQTIVLEASDGMVITDGTNYGKKFYLPADADTSVYSEITEAEAEELEKANNND